MLSRVAINAVKGFNRPVCQTLVGSIRSTTTSPGSSSSSGYAGEPEEFTWYAKSGTKFPWEGPERDVVNFPRPVQPVEPGKVRFLFVPEEWFNFFYKKTGVTGPYALGFGLFNYCMSKELWIIDHEYYYVYATIFIIAFANHKFGDKISGYLESERQKQEDELVSLRKDELDTLKADIESEKKSQWQFEGQRLLIDAQKENIALQQEAAYRERAMMVYNEVKKRLEFHTQKQLMERRVSQKHMATWIVDQVLKSITPQQEQDTLKKCLVDLQGLASKA